ncbi:hypothetical protein AAF712_003731 [Marasmius tenuissimus]|uniref:F-box domain-containing protein n=1 Tax=Marasmius tenuissimus TaxID=585030 RepID=A0ABR3A7S4_9AGAR
MLSNGDFDCRLPPELIDITISFCSPKTRLACSLVCRSWLPICRSHSFGGGQYLQIEKPIACKGLLSFLTSEIGCSIIGHVSAVHFSIEQGPLDVDQEILEVREDINAYSRREHLRNATLYTENIRSLLPLLTDKVVMLSSLSIKTEMRDSMISSCPAADIFSPQFSLASSLMNTFSNIINLTFHSSCEYVHEVIHFICSFPNLETLSTHSLCLNPYRRSQPPQSPDRLPETLRSLDLSTKVSPWGPTDQIWMQWFATHPSLPKLDTLSVSCWRFEGDDLTALLNLCNKATLRTLDVNFRVEGNPLTMGGDLDLEVMALEAFNLSELPSLRTLGITFNKFNTLGLAAVIHFFRHTLATIRDTSPEFESLEFNTGAIPGTFGDDHDLVKDAWGHLDRTIFNLPMKPRVCFCVSGPGDDDDESRRHFLRLKEMFPRCFKQQRLVVRFNPVL